MTCSRFYGTPKANGSLFPYTQQMEGAERQQPSPTSSLQVSGISPELLEGAGDHGIHLTPAAAAWECAGVQLGQVSTGAIRSDSGAALKLLSVGQILPG